jgi:hypothetical protein
MKNTNKVRKNPFEVITPEDLGIEDMNDLFVDDLDEFKMLLNKGHMMLKGPRGVGKSMMFRYMQVDCMCSGSTGFSELEFLGFHIPMKNVSFPRLTEIQRLGNSYAAELIEEHLLALSFAQIIFTELLELKTTDSVINNVDAESLYNYYIKVFLPFFSESNDQYNIEHTFFGILTAINERLKTEYRITANYVKRLAMPNSLNLEYTGSFFNYLEFFYPLLRDLKTIKGFPESPVYLMVDDAHCLTLLQTQILNSWIATRTAQKISIKISTQYSYKTYYTVNGGTIDTPHDYKQIDMSDIYTANARKGSYRNLVAKVLSKRFNKYSFGDVKPDLFFPPNHDQEDKIKEIQDRYIKNYHDGEGRGARPSDDAYRYATADYIKSLMGQRKSGYTYSYAGFNQLVNISSGVIRYFLDAAAKMYAEQEVTNEGTPVTCIKDSIQSDVVTELARKFLKDEISDYSLEGHINAAPKEDFQKLTNLINALGLLFSTIQFSNRSERRVFSIAISDELTEETEKILALGVNYAYLHRSTIGRKERGYGRTWLYVLNRRLAPIWRLDPNSFAGYLFIQNKHLEAAMKNPKLILRRLDEKSDIDNNNKQVQLELFDIDNRIASDWINDIDEDKIDIITGTWIKSEDKEP